MKQEQKKKRKKLKRAKVCNSVRLNLPNSAAFTKLRKLIEPTAF